MADLSPAAKAVQSAFDDAIGIDLSGDGYIVPLATAIRALADQVVPQELASPLMRQVDLERFCQRQHTRAQLLAIANLLLENTR